MCLLALVTDNLDGYLARRSKVASVYGRMWDSLGDKAFYVAVIVSFNSQRFLGSLISWALIVREISLYITRIMFIENYPSIERTRPLTNLHGKLLWLTIALGLSQMYAVTHGLAWPLHGYMQVSAYLALAFGVGSMVQFMKLG